MAITEITQELAATGRLAAPLLLRLLQEYTEDDRAVLAQAARRERERYYGRDVYIRGLIECTSYCRNDCYYCGLRRSNARAQRYRLTQGQILDCCRQGYALGFRTFVLQGGEDAAFSEAAAADIVSAIKERYPDCAVTLSLGEQPRSVYAAWFRAGADRYLLRHETADAEHYRLLHPASQKLARRKQCLWDLKELGYQVGSGFMVGSPGQTAACLAADIAFLQELQPAMIGIGPFIPHQDTPFAGQQAGSLSLTLLLLSVLRLLFPRVLLPSTTALATLSPEGHELGLLAGANVIMPNLSPPPVRSKYSLYDHKACTGIESAAGVAGLARRMAAIGYRVVVDRGDSQLR